jgi:hypothetical protein
MHFKIEQKLSLTLSLTFVDLHSHLLCKKVIFLFFKITNEYTLELCVRLIRFKKLQKNI